MSGRKAGSTFICQLSIERGVDLAKGTDKPLALALGIILGCEANTLADVSNLCKQYTEDRILLLDQVLALRLSADTHKIIVANKELQDIDSHFIFVSDDKSTKTLSEKIALVYSCKIVVGNSSFETYLACCLKKPVLEIQTNPLLYKWNNPNYRCITDPSRIQELVPQGIVECLRMATNE